MISLNSFSLGVFEESLVGAVRVQKGRILRFCMYRIW